MAVDMALLFALADPKMLAWNVSVAKVCAAETALLSNFVWNHLWTFRDRRGAPGGWRSLRRRFLRFNAICGLGIGFNVLLLNGFYHGLGWNLYLSNLVAIGLVALWNFGMSARFGWGPAEPPDAERHPVADEVKPRPTRMSAFREDRG